MSSENVFELTERIINPRPPKKENPAPVPAPFAEARDSWEEETPPQEVSRARAIFDASQDAKPFSPSDFDFAMDEERNFEITPPASVESSPAQPLPRPNATPRSNRILGMTPMQLAILAALGLVFLILMAVFAYLVL